MATIQTQSRKHAIVLGGSIAGMFAARVLSDHFERVTIIERDPVNDAPEARKGQPQTRHLHGVLIPAQEFIRDRMPGVEDQLLEGGAMRGDAGEFARWYHFDDYKYRGTIGIDGMTLSRPFLEWHVRRFVTALPNVTLLDETVADDVLTDTDKSRITGVKLTYRGGEERSEEMAADLVIDVCGRGSKTPKWLQELGYAQPEKEEVKVNVGYATRIYRRSPQHIDEPEILMVSPTPPQQKVGAFLFPVEDDRWILTVGGWHGDHAPTHVDGFNEFVRNLPAQDIYNVICQAEPLSDIMTHKFPSSRRFRYDQLDRFPDNYLVIGDAIASFNPIYGQGMSSAAMQVNVLDKALKQGGAISWCTFFNETKKVIDQIWELAVGEDFRYPETEGKRPFAIDLKNQYVEWVHRAVHKDPVVYKQFLKVMHLVDSPMSLMQPHILWRVLRSRVL